MVITTPFAGPISSPIVSDNNRESTQSASVSSGDIVTSTPNTIVQVHAPDEVANALANSMEEQKREMEEMQQRYESLAKRNEMIMIKNQELRKNQVGSVNDTTKKTAELGKRKRPRYEQCNDDHEFSELSTASSTIPSSSPPTFASSEPPSSSLPSSPITEPANEGTAPKIKIEPSMHKYAFNKLISRAEIIDLTKNDDTQDDEQYSDPSEYVLDLPAHAGCSINDPSVPSSYLRGLYFNDAILLKHPGLQKAIEWRLRRENALKQSSSAIVRLYQKEFKKPYQRKFPGMLSSKWASER